MEINNKCDEVEQEVCLTKNTKCIEETYLKTKELLKNCDNYEEFRRLLTDNVSKKIVDDVTNVVVNGNEAPVFDDLDESLNKKSKEDKAKEAKEEEQKEEENSTPTTQDQQPNQSSETPNDQIKSESVILKMCEAIVTESYVKQHKKMTSEEGLNRAIIEYCIVQMDGLFKQNAKQDGFDRYLKW
jgi:CO dehydrogenase/acetyl-CoA synthase beta subunit